MNHLPSTTMTQSIRPGTRSVLGRRSSHRISSMRTVNNLLQRAMLRGCLLLSLAFIPNAVAFAQTGGIQLWQGVLDVGAAKLTLNVEIKLDEAGRYSAFVYVVEQGNAKIPVDEIKVTKEQIAFEIKTINASFKGSLTEAGQVCEGSFSQNGMSFDLVLRRVESFEGSAGKMVEYWKGTLDFQGSELEMGLKVFEENDGSLSAKLDSYSQGVTDLPVEFEKNGDDYVVNFPAARLQFRGTLSPSKEKLTGTITQAGTENELEFIRTEFNEVPTYNRPQTPKEPLPYKNENVRYKNSRQSIELVGTLSLPAGEGPFPVAITISGSGASDRDGTHFEHKPYLVIADYLARQGIAVLRFDDRGSGESTGDYPQATSADLATDVEAGIEFLKQHPAIDANKIGLIGHSEGGLIAPMVAAKRDDVHFIVLLAGTGVNGGVILQSQSTAMMKAAGEPDKMLEANRNIHDAILSLIADNPEISQDEIQQASQEFLNSIDDEGQRKMTEPLAKQLVSILKSKWVRFFVEHEPVPTLEQVECHVLAMNGEKDLQVLCDLNLGPIEEALENGKPASYKVVRLPNTNHMFQETDGSGTPGDYGKIEETFSPKALNVIGDWIKQVTK